MEKIRTKRAADSEHGKAYPVGVKIVIKEEPLDDDILHGHTQVLREECMVESQTGDGTSDNSDVQDPLLNLAPQTDVKMENLGALGNGIGVAEEIANVAGSSATKRKHSDANELQDDIGTAKTNPHENGCNICPSRELWDARTTKVQYKKMIDIMETAPDIARALSRGSQTQFWEELTTQLNALGPPVKTVGTWKRVWFDYKCAVKKKLLDNKNALAATGYGRRFGTKTLNELEERVATISNLRSIVVGNGRPRYEIDRQIKDNQLICNMIAGNKNITSEDSSEYEKDDDSLPTSLITSRKRKYTDIVVGHSLTQYEIGRQAKDTQRISNVEAENSNITSEDNSEHEKDGTPAVHISRPTRLKRSRKRKNTEAVLQQNKEMLVMMKRFVEIQEKSFKLQEKTNDLLAECTKQLTVCNNLLAKQTNMSTNP
ncbi:uncharacterized protein LOC3289901 isoform X1 [Anopheles gambiae]|uniref:uncharacterized protein LOC3289901 isoform X1 n=1 Tax=Anopheles gambiae TaxID=7165 RepID=UPI002AC96632|nr:uncharacterized protein LOC3289901 isoform X1 [Anopheles gambiae]